MGLYTNLYLELGRTTLTLSFNLSGFAQPTRFFGLSLVSKDIGPQGQNIMQQLTLDQGTQHHLFV